MSEPVPVGDFNAVQSLCILYDAFRDNPSTRCAESNLRKQIKIFHIFGKLFCLTLGLLQIRFTNLAETCRRRARHAAFPPKRWTRLPYPALPLLCRCDRRHDSGLEKDTEGYLGLAEKWFVFSMIWSVMAAADEDGRAKLDAFLRDVEVA